MASVAISLNQAIISELRTQLSTIPQIESAAYRLCDGVLTVWIGIPDVTREVRNLLFDVEDRVMKEFSSLHIDFDLVTLESGRQLSEFVSTAQPLMQRAA